jgi:hypothetical protein
VTTLASHRCWTCRVNTLLAFSTTEPACAGSTSRTDFVASADDAPQARDATIRIATTDNTFFTRFIVCFIGGFMVVLVLVFWMVDGGSFLFFVSDFVLRISCLNSGVWWCGIAGFLWDHA